MVRGVSWALHHAHPTVSWSRVRHHVRDGMRRIPSQGEGWAAAEADDDR